MPFSFFVSLIAFLFKRANRMRNNKKQGLTSKEEQNEMEAREGSDYYASLRVFIDFFVTINTLWCFFVPCLTELTFCNFRVPSPLCHQVLIRIIP